MKKRFGLMMVFAVLMIMGCDNETTNNPPATQYEQLDVTALNNWFNVSGIQISLNGGVAQAPNANMRNAFTVWLNANSWTSAYSTQKNTPANFESLFIRWTINKQPTIEVVGVNFNEDAFREWAGQPQRSIQFGTGSPLNAFTDNLIENALAFARTNWNYSTDRNDDATFNSLTIRWADSYYGDYMNRPIIITKGMEFAYTKNVLGKYMKGMVVHVC